MAQKNNDSEKSADGNTLIPNTFQYPNWYVDELMHLLTPEEFMVLTFAIRQILGWEEHRATRRDRISLSQFLKGKFKDGKRVSWGVGLSEGTVKKCLRVLHETNILVKVGSLGPQGQEYELNLGQLGEINVAFLQNRRRRREETNRARTARARQVKAGARDSSQSQPESGLCDNPISGLSDNRIAHQTGMSDNPHSRLCDNPISGLSDKTTETQETQGNPTDNTDAALPHEDFTPETPPRPNAFALYERACGTLSPIIAEKLGDLIDEFEEHRRKLPRAAPGADVPGDGWVCAAIEEAVKSSKDGRVNYNFVQAILNRWKAEGYGTRKGGSRGQRRSPARPGTMAKAPQGVGKGGAPDSVAAVYRQDGERLRRKNST